MHGELLMKIYTAAEVVALRKKLRLNQSEFWGRFGITQSAGSRYESGREIPLPMQVLLNVAFRQASVSEKLVQQLRQN